MDKENEEFIKNPEVAYKILADVSNLDVKLMWDRSYVLLVLQGAILAFIGSNSNINNNVIKIFLCFFGLIIAVLWYRATKGGSFWVSHWEERMRAIEECTFGNFINIYRNHPSVADDKKHRLEFKKKGYISTRKTLILVSVLMILLWLLLIVYLVCESFMLKPL